ncbi:MULTISPECIES: response regulator transcription factor [unclassified Streptomyces]|uniref:response regulator transcription factor n=1 Tax=unclassified Streptomyces TaxID=2593676 RepID=UPI0036ED5AAB
MPIEVLLAHSAPSTRARISALLAAEPDIEVVGAHDDGVRALAAAGRLLPGVVLTGLRLNGLDGVELTRRLAGRDGPHGVRVVVLAGSGPAPRAFAALAAGARGLLQDTDRAELPRAVRLVAGGGALVSPRLTGPLIEACVRGAALSAASDVPTLDALTRREREVLSLVGTGLSTQEIADRLVVAETTAKTLVRRTMVKLGARSRTRLVAIAYESGMIRPRARR